MSEPGLILHPFGRGLTPPLEQALEQRGLAFAQIDPHAPSKWPRQALACVIWFYYPLRAPLKVYRLKRQLAARGIPLLAWNRDAPHYLNRAAWRLDWLDRARLFDIYASHSLVDARRRFADSVLYLANAADISRYHLHGATLAELRDPVRYEHDVSFFGAMDGSRYKEMRSRQEFFAALRERLAARGIRFLFRESADMSVEEQVALIQKSRINLNFGASCDYGAPVASGLPERCYGIPACGGFLLCDKRTHARDDFTPNDNWAEFDGLDDAVTQIEYWLANFAAARDLAERCHAHVMARHTYANRAETLHQVLLEWHEGKRGRLP
ncbi:MAG: glycosyltransferase [Rhodocyclales bacterium]|nr:glycosyltransferase [Rhodocyclales bacterium]